jgi:putative PIN family toxin of toxin-antitoxin system
MLRAVLDTNVVLASHKSSNPQSPNREIIERWVLAEFVLLCSKDTLAEYVEKLIEHKVPEIDILTFIRAVGLLAEMVQIKFFHLRCFPEDSDDVAFLLCALNGNASHLASYDDHLLDLAHFYQSAVTICQPIFFLADLRRG